MTYSSATDSRFERTGPIYVDPAGRTWFAPGQGGLCMLERDHIQRVSATLPANEVVYSITGRGDEMWIGRQRGGLTRLQVRNGIVTCRTYTNADGLAQNSVFVVLKSRDGSVWAGTLSGGVSRFQDGRFTTYTAGSRLAANTVSSILEARDGTMWFATSNGLSSLSNGQWKTYKERDGLPSANVFCLFEDSSGTLWGGTSAGLAFLVSGNIQVRSLPDVLREPIFGMTEDKNGWLWITTSHHVLQVARDKLFQGKVEPGDIREYSAEDGLPSNEGVNRSKSVLRDSEGRIWISLKGGLSVADPSHLATRWPPAIPHVEAVRADGIAINATDLMRVPAGRKRITFVFTALSLAVPERIRFRYFLEGFDHQWSEPDAAREAVYTNLGPGTYRFRLLASNSYGEWNGSESFAAFEVEPAFWQTWWFRSTLALLMACMVLVLYRLRLHRLTQELKVRFEGRLDERTRIAQDLHDTLLQGLVSASMQLHVANMQLPADSPAKPLVGHVLELMARVIDEGRNAIRGLRTSPGDSSDLEQAFSRVPQELASPTSVDLRVIVEGMARPLRPVIRDEIYLVGREALVNAFRHSRASQIEAELDYAAHSFRVVVRDNGCGIEPQVLAAGRDGHWGLSGMRERAERMGARLKIFSRAAAGTEIELLVPGPVAFESGPSDPPTGWFSRLYSQRGNVQGAEGRKE